MREQLARFPANCSAMASATVRAPTRRKSPRGATGPGRVSPKTNSGRRPHGRRRLAMRGRLRRRGGKEISRRHRQPGRLQPAGGRASVWACPDPDMSDKL